MSKNTVAVIGSGIVGSTIAYLLTAKGYHVEVFEKGPEYPYPHRPQFNEKIRYLYDNPLYRLPGDIKGLTFSGDYIPNIDDERPMVVGGSATRWEAITLRMSPDDFRTESLYGYNKDWPITYDELEPYYCKAEKLLGVSGTDTDNPFAPNRSKEYPLPPFELSYGDVILADRLRKHGIVLHTTPQARTRRRYLNRPACVNYGTCEVCPIGARYSPNNHLKLAMKTGLCKVHTDVSVKSVPTDRAGRAEAVIYQHNDSGKEQEFGAGTIIVAAGAIESARLLLLSKSGHNPDGLGNSSGHVGRHLVFHHIHDGSLYYKDSLFPGRFGGWTGQSQQFQNPPTRGKHGGVKVEFSSRTPLLHDDRIEDIVRETLSGPQIVEKLKPLMHRRSVSFHAESLASPAKYVSLSDKLDRFGDPFAHVHYEASEFDLETYRFTNKLFRRFVEATGAESVSLSEFNRYRSGAHHMGTVRMGLHVDDSVVDPYCRIHETRNIFVVGGGNFVSSSTVNPTLTIVALAIRVSDFIKDQLM